MERKGSYNKGHAGHPRNINTYRLLQEKYKKWRGPAFAALSLMLVFGVAPLVGDNLQTSVLTSQATHELIQEDPATATKTILEYAQGIIKECQVYGLDECVTEGKTVMNSLSNDSVSAEAVFAAVVAFEDHTVTARAQAACRYEAPKYVNDLKEAQSKLATFVDSYAETLHAPVLSGDVKSIDASLSDISEVLARCGE